MKKIGLRVSVAVAVGVEDWAPVIGTRAVNVESGLGRGDRVKVAGSPVEDGVGEKTSLAYSAWVSALSVLMVGVGEPPVFGI